MTAAQVSDGRMTYFLADTQNRVVPFLVVSILAHIAFFGFAWWESRRIDDEGLLYKKAIMVQPVRWAPEVRPEHWMPRLEPTAPEAEAKAEPLKLKPNPNTPVETKAPEKPEKSSAQKTKERERRMAKALDRVRNKFNSWDGSPDGVKGAPSSRAVQILGSVYAGQLAELFRANFNVPRVIPEDELKRLTCKILIKIDRSGALVKHQLMEGSGNALFDSSAMRAVKITPRVPLPDDMLKKLVFSQGILINFSWKES